jgi:predicted transcriptional regulator
MPTALDDIAFLARSSNRVDVLSALADGSRERSDLETMTGVSRVTAKRILDDFVERGWVRKSGRAYETTALGNLVQREFAAFFETMQAANRLQDVVAWLPDDGLDFDLRRLADADITLPTRNNPFAPFRRVVEKLTGAEQVSELTHSMPPELLTAHYESVTTDGQQLTVVLEATALDEIIGEAESAAALEAMLERGTELRAHDGMIPYALCLADDSVGLVLTDGLGLPRAFIETTDDTVISWAASTIDEFSQEGWQVEPSVLKQ